MERRKLTILVALLIGFVAGFVAMESRPSTAARAAAVARAEARAQGFKFDFAEFGRPSQEDLAHSAVFSEASKRLRNRDSTGEQALSLEFERWGPTTNLPFLLEDHFAAMTAAILKPRPIRFEASPANAPLAVAHGIYTITRGEWTEGVVLKVLARNFAARTSIALKRGRPDVAWTNLLAVNALAARYRPGPFAGAHHVSARLVEAAFRLDFEMLSTQPWSDHHFAALEEVWRSAEFFEGLEEVPMSTGANLLALNNAARTAARTGGHPSPGDMFNMTMSSSGSLSRSLRAMLDAYTMCRDFARRTSHLNDSELIAFHRKRVEVFRDALMHGTWSEMSATPTLVRPPKPNLTPAYMSPPLFGLAMGSPPESTLIYDDSVEPFTAKVEAEARRRILLAALAVERAKLRLGHLPATLAEAGDVPPDFMDGQPLRYRRELDGSYKIYCAGLDLADDDGSGFGWSGPVHGSKGDIIWPRLLHEGDTPKPAAPP